jgi:isopenicillin N synthase-like dioxygenase
VEYDVWRSCLAGLFPARQRTYVRPALLEGGLYLGTELPKQHPLVLANTPLHGSNLFPDVPDLKETILAYTPTVECGRGGG